MGISTPILAVDQLSAAVDRPTSVLPTQNSPLLSVRDLHTTFHSRGTSVHALRGVSFDLFQGETLVLLGESGSGKSVTARSLMRLYGRNADTTGTAMLEDTDLLTVPAKDMRPLRNTKLSLVPQDPIAAMDPLRPVGKQIGDVLKTHKVTRNKRDTRDRVDELLNLVGIADPRRIAKSFPHQLSGGMCQRVAIAIAVSCSPGILIADEPTTALDVTVQAQILDVFRSLQAKLGTALLLVTHDVGVAADMADRVVVMYAGRIVERGPVGPVLNTSRHPYTAALLASIPTPGTARGTLKSIAGYPAIAGEPHEGCPFAPRCTKATDACLKTEPNLTQVGAGHGAACHMLNEAVGD